MECNHRMVDKKQRIIDNTRRGIKAEKSTIMYHRGYMRITLETTDPTNLYQTKVCVEVPNDGLVIEDVYKNLIKPVLLGYGYAEGSIEQLFERDAKEDDKTF